MKFGPTYDVINDFRSSSIDLSYHAFTPAVYYDSQIYTFGRMGARIHTFVFTPLYYDTRINTVQWNEINVIPVSIPATASNQFNSLYIEHNAF